MLGQDWVDQAVVSEHPSNLCFIEDSIVEVVVGLLSKARLSGVLVEQKLD